MNIIERISSPTPGFFKRVRTIGLAAGTIGGSLLAASSVLPPVFVQIGSYLVVAGSITAALSQTVTTNDEKVTKN